MSHHFELDDKDFIRFGLTEGPSVGGSETCLGERAEAAVIETTEIVGTGPLQDLSKVEPVSSGKLWQSTADGNILAKSLGNGNPGLPRSQRDLRSYNSTRAVESHCTSFSAS